MHHMISSLVLGIAATHANVDAYISQRMGGDVELDSIPDVGDPSYVGADYAPLEWRGGGLLRAHMYVWKMGRIVSAK